MTICVFIHLNAKRAKTVSLLDLGATENFLSLDYAKWLGLPIKRLPFARKLFNVDGTENKVGQLQFYTNLAIRTRPNTTNMRFFLTHLGEHKAILGYPWFAAVQPKIDWKCGWIDHTQLPIIFKALDAAKARFIPCTINKPWPLKTNQLLLCKATIGTHQETDPLKIPQEYSRHSKVFSEEQSQRLPKHTIWDHTIKLLPKAPSTMPGWLLPLNQKEIQEVHNFIQEHLKRGTICESWSPYTANFFVKKKDGKLRPVQDYWPINKWTRHNQNVSPLIPQVINRLRGCTLFTKVDIQWGYNNIRIKEGDKWKAAFLMPKGLFEPTIMFFRLTNSPATFQMMMNTIFCTEVAQGWLSIYMDNIAIHTKCKANKTKEQHLERHWLYTHHMLHKLEQNDLYLKSEKCEFEKKQINYLGVIVSNRKLQMDPKKLKGVADWPIPKNPTNICKFLGFTGYYRYFIQEYSKIAHPLLDLTKKAIIWDWTKRQHKAFEELKTRMCSCLVLTQPDFNKPFFLQTDASAYGVGAILLQEGEHHAVASQKPKLHPITYYSATFTPTKWNYDIYEWELLAIMKALTHWQHYLGWMKNPFTILTDHANLQYWKSPRKLNYRTARWHANLQEYDFVIKHIPRKINTPADKLSCPPNTNQGENDN